MATFVAIPEKTQTKTAMKKLLDYVMQDKKTLYENPDTGQSYKLISGQNCMPETALREFMNTKKQYKKRQVFSSSSICNLLNPIVVQLLIKFTLWESNLQNHLKASRL